MTNQENRSTILEYIFRNAPVARSTIAKQTQITPATVTSISGNFIQEGIIQEIGAEDNAADCSPGRKRILLDIVPDKVYAMGIEFTSRHIRFLFATCEVIQYFSLRFLSRKPIMAISLIL